MDGILNVQITNFQAVFYLGWRSSLLSMLQAMPLVIQYGWRTCVNAIVPRPSEFYFANRMARD